MAEQIIIRLNRLSTADLNDTVFIDNLINTQSSGYIYKIEFWNNEPGKDSLLVIPVMLLQFFLSIAPGDRKARFTITRNVPWINTRYDFFRLNETTTVL